MTYPSLPIYRNDRVVGMYYLKKDEVVIWNGKTLHCVHGKRKSYCVYCSGASLCQEHQRAKWSCKECNKSIVCVHGNVSKTCYKCAIIIECKHKVLKFKCKFCCGSFFCNHGKNKFLCFKCRPEQYEKHKDYVRKKLFCKKRKSNKKFFENLFSENNNQMTEENCSLLVELFPEII